MSLEKSYLENFDFYMNLNQEAQIYNQDRLGVTYAVDALFKRERCLFGIQVGAILGGAIGTFLIPLSIITPFLFLGTFGIVRFCYKKGESNEEMRRLIQTQFPRHADLLNGNRKSNRKVIQQLKGVQVKLETRERDLKKGYQLLIDNQDSEEKKEEIQKGVENPVLAQLKQYRALLMDQVQSTPSLCEEETVAVSHKM